MWAQNALSRIRDRPDLSVEPQRSALERLDGLLQQSRQLDAMRDIDRPIAPRLMRRAVFAVYCEAVEAGAGTEAARMLHERVPRPATVGPDPSR